MNAERPFEPAIFYCTDSCFCSAGDGTFSKEVAPNAGELVHRMSASTEEYPIQYRKGIGEGWIEVGEGGHAHLTPEGRQQLEVYRMA